MQRFIHKFKVADRNSNKDWSQTAKDLFDMAVAKEMHGNMLRSIGDASNTFKHGLVIFYMITLCRIAGIETAAAILIDRFIHDEKQLTVQEAFNELSNIVACIEYNPGSLPDTVPPSYRLPKSIAGHFIVETHTMMQTSAQKRQTDTKPLSIEGMDAGILEYVFPNNSDPPPHPKHFDCPISLHLMTDPVIASDGICYEAKYLQESFKTRGGSSPMTRLPLHPIAFRIVFLRQEIVAWVESNGGKVLKKMEK